MKRKITFFGICVLFCTLVISLGSCQKDYSGDIDQLKTDVAANKLAIASLNSAITAGKLVKSVTSITNGYTITFSDNTTINILNGTNGATGATGAAGAAGAAGANGITPVLGVDANGYWTVTTGTSTVQLKDASGNPVKAKMSDAITVIGGKLAVGGVATAVDMPAIVFNTLTNQLAVTCRDENGNLVTKLVGLASDFVLGNDIISLVSPVGKTTAIVNFGSVPATSDAYIAAYPSLTSATQNASYLAWASANEGVAITYGSVTKASGVLPVIVNPSAASIAGYTFSVIKQDGTAFAIAVGAPTVGFTGNFVNFTSSATGLYSIPLTPSFTQAATLDGTTTNELAIRATKGTREVSSGFQYSVRVAKYTNTSYSISGPVYAQIGKTVSLLSYTTPATSATDFFTSGYRYGTLVAPTVASDTTLITKSKANFTTVSNTATIANLDMKVIPMKLRTVDWLGQWQDNDAVNVTFYAPLDGTVSDVSMGSYTLSTSTTTLTTSLTPFFSQLESMYKLELWRMNATHVTPIVEFYNTATSSWATAAGVSAVFLNYSLTALTTPASDYTTEVEPIRNVKLTFDPTVALPGSYRVRIVFDDRRTVNGGNSIPNYSEFVLTMPLTVVNPSTPSIATLTTKVTGAWNGQTLTVYGTGTAPIQGNPLQWYYDINKAYVNLTANIPNWAFVGVVTDPVTTYSNTGSYFERFNINSGNIYKTYSYNLYYYYFGNTNNKLLVENINVTAKSEVKEGSLALKVYTDPLLAPTPATLQLTNGVILTTNGGKGLKISPYYVAKDYLGVDLNAFDVTGSKDGRIASTTVAVATSASASAPLVLLTNSVGEWFVNATTNVAELQQAYVDIPLTVTITDLLGQKLIGTATVRVVKP